MARVASSFTPSLSQDGKRVVFLSNRGGLPQIWMAETAAGGGEPRQVGAFEDPVTGVEWSPDGEWLALSLAPGGGLNEQIYLMRPDGTGLQRITDGGKENNRLSGWSGTRVRYSSSRDNPGSLEPWIHDTATGQRRKVAASSGVSTLTDVSRDGKRAVVSRLVSRGDDNLFLIDLTAEPGKGNEVLLTPHEPPGSFGGGRFSLDGNTIYLASNLNSETEHFAKVRIGQDGKPLPLQKLTFRDSEELDDFELNYQGMGAVLVWNVAGRSELGILDLLSLRFKPVPGLPGEILGGLDFSTDGRRLVFTAGGAKLPTDVWVLDLESGRTRQLTKSPHDGVDLAKLVSPELVRFPAHDGLELTGWLYRPPGAGQGPGPVVISFHGGPESQERPNFNYTYQALLAPGHRRLRSQRAGLLRLRQEVRQPGQRRLCGWTP